MPYCIRYNVKKFELKKNYIYYFSVGGLNNFENFGPIPKSKDADLI